MKALIVSSNAWNESNSFGNTYENIFRDLKEFQVGFITLSYEPNSTDLFHEYYQVTDKMLVKNLLNPKKKTGRILENTGQDTSQMDTLSKEETKQVDFLRKKRYTGIFVLRDLLWKIGRWKSADLKKFIDKEKCDFIFVPFGSTGRLANFQMFLKKYTGLPMVGYIWDDYYSLKQFNLSPFWWLYRIYVHFKLKKVFRACDYIYVISRQQKEEYERLLKRPCKILYKGYKFDEKPENVPERKGKIVLAYTGNIGSNRWKNLYLIGKAIKKLNYADKIQLDVYSKTPLTDEMKQCLSPDNCINFKGGISFQEVIQVQKDADILVYTESYDLKPRLIARLSFSTKLVDYFHQAKCIFAVGPKDVASMDYLIQNDAAITATDEREIEEKLRNLVENPDMVREYGDKAWECGKRNHQIDDIQDMLCRDFKELIAEK